jgi:hypothetical protein
MPVSAFFEYNSFVDELSKGGHNLTTAVLKVALTNTAPNVASHLILNTTTDQPPPAAAAGYAALTLATTPSMTSSPATFHLAAVDAVFQATGGSIGPFRYAVVYNTSSSPANKLMGYYDYATALTLLDTETLTVDFGTDMLTLAIP